jgi:hypothetical protein
MIFIWLRLFYDYSTSGGIKAGKEINYTVRIGSAPRGDKPIFFGLCYSSSISRYFTMQTNNKKPVASATGCGPLDKLSSRRFYFCQVRFLWRFALRRFRRLCFAIFRRRFFFKLPMVCAN